MNGKPFSDNNNIESFCVTLKVFLLTYIAFFSLQI